MSERGSVELDSKTQGEGTTDRQNKAPASGCEDDIKEVLEAIQTATQSWSSWHDEQAQLLGHEDWGQLAESVERELREEEALRQRAQLRLVVNRRD